MSDIDTLSGVVLQGDIEVKIPRSCCSEQMVESAVFPGIVNIPATLINLLCLKEPEDYLAPLVKLKN